MLSLSLTASPRRNQSKKTKMTTMRSTQEITTRQSSNSNWKPKPRLKSRLKLTSKKTSSKLLRRKSYNKRWRRFSKQKKCSKNNNQLQNTVTPHWTIRASLGRIWTTPSSLSDGAKMRRRTLAIGLLEIHTVKTGAWMEISLWKEVIMILVWKWNRSHLSQNGRNEM